MGNNNILETRVGWSTINCDAFSTFLSPYNYKTPPPPLSTLQQQQWLQSTPAQNATQTSTSTPPTLTHRISTSKPETKTQSPSPPSTLPSSNSKKKIRSVHSSKQSTIGEFKERELRSSVIIVIILLVMYMMMVLLLLILLVSFIWVLVKLFLELLDIGLNPNHFESLLKLNSLLYFVDIILSVYGWCNALYFFVRIKWFISFTFFYFLCFLFN